MNSRFTAVDQVNVEWSHQNKRFFCRIKLCNLQDDSQKILHTSLEVHQLLSQMISEWKSYIKLWTDCHNRMGVTKINIIFPKLSSDYDRSKSKLMSPRIQFPLECDMLLSVSDYSPAYSNESARGE